MGFWSKLVGRKRERLDDDSGSVNLAFVLLDQPRLPTAESIISCYPEFAAGGEELVEAKDDEDESASNEIISLNFDTDEQVFVALVPVAVPEGEADEAAQFSVSSLGTGWKLPQHHAHLLVTMLSPDSEDTVTERLSRFTSLLAAVAQASQAVGIYWGNASATHDSEFFISIASEGELVPRIMLWTGISIARETDGRLSLLSLGMRQLNLPDLLLVVAEDREDDALETFFDLLAYVVQRGEALPDGDTVGRTEQERLPVHYVKSPIDKQKKVWRVELM